MSSLGNPLPRIAGRLYGICGLRADRRIGPVRHFVCSRIAAAKERTGGSLPPPCPLLAFLCVPLTKSSSLSGC